MKKSWRPDPGYGDLLLPRGVRYWLRVQAVAQREQQAPDNVCQRLSRQPAEAIIKDWGAVEDEAASVAMGWTFGLAMREVDREGDVDTSTAVIEGFKSGYFWDKVE